MKKTIINIYRIARIYSDKDMPIYAANASFFMLIAAFPLIMFAMSLLQLVPGLGKQELLMALFQVLPDMPQIESFVSNVIDNLYVQSAPAIASITAVTTLVSASAGVYSIGRGLRKIYGTGKGNYFLNRFFAALYTFLFLVLFVVTLVLLVLGGLIRGFLNVHFLPVARLIDPIAAHSGLIAACILFATFLLIYTIMPGKFQKTKAQIPGALLSTAGWVGLSYLFSFYFTNIRKMSYLYGSLTAIILLMFWMYAMICILFLGAVVNAFLSGPPHARKDCSQTP